jgi:hypothetical protein
LWRRLSTPVAGAVSNSWTGTGVYADLVPQHASILLAETPRPRGRTEPVPEGWPKLADEVLGDLGQQPRA